MQIRCLAGAEERPILPRFHPLHEEIGNPVGRIHIVGTAAVITGIPAQLEELQEIVVPAFEVGAARAPAFSALVHCHQLVIVKFQEWNDPLALSIGSGDMAAGTPDRGPAAAKPSGPLREIGVLRNSPLHNALDRIIYPIEIAGGQLGVQCA